MVYMGGQYLEALYNKMQKLVKRCRGVCNDDDTMEQ